MMKTVSELDDVFMKDVLSAVSMVHRTPMLLDLTLSYKTRQLNAVLRALVAANIKLSRIRTLKLDVIFQFSDIYCTETSYAIADSNFDTRSLVSLLVSMHSLEDLTLGQCLPSSAEETDELFVQLRELPALRSLTLHTCRFDLVRNLKGLKKLTGLTKLDLENGSIDKATAAALADCLQHITSLTSLRIKGAAGDDVSVLCPGLLALPGLTKLELTGVNLLPTQHTDAQRQQFCRSMSGSLQELTLRCASDATVSALPATLSSLRRLDLRDSRLTENGTAKLATALGVMQNLRYLNLSSVFEYNERRGACLTRLLVKLKEIATLEELDLSNNRLVAADVLKAAVNLNSLRSLRKLDLSQDFRFRMDNTYTGSADVLAKLNLCLHPDCEVRW